MKILISAGHTLKDNGSGAIGYINESNENRILSKKVYELLKLQDGISVDYHEVNSGKDYLQQQASFANKKNYDLVVQIHFNAHKTTSSTMGTETLYSSSRGKVYAERVTNKLGQVYKQRGAKVRNDLYWLNNTKAAAILIETCFVDSKADTDFYNSNKDLTAKLIVEGILNKAINDTSKPSQSDSDVMYRVCAGSYSDEANAEEQQRKLKEKGFDSFLVAYTK